MLLPIVAEMFVVTDAGTGVVVILKVPEVLPAGTVMEAGVVAHVALEARVTTMPPVGASPLRKTVPVELIPPVSELGETVT